MAALVSVVMAGVGAALAFAPSWDSYTLRTPAGLLGSMTAGNSFANPGPEIAGDVAAMTAIVAVVLAAVLWRPARLGAALLAGAIIPLAAQAISALIQLSATSPLQFGITVPQAERVGLTIHSGVTVAFWVYCAFVIALALSCAQMTLTSDLPPAPLALPAAGPGSEDGEPANLNLAPQAPAEP